MRRFIGFSILFALAACGGAGDITGASAPASVSVSVDVGSRVVGVGDSAVFQVSVERAGGVAGPVTLRVDGLPKGVVARFSAPVVVDGRTLAALTLVAADTAEDSRATVVVGIREAGIKARNATIRLWVSSDSSASSLKPRPSTSTWSPSKNGG